MDGQPDLINPHRAELSDLVSILYILLSVSQHFKIQSGKAIIYCDCLSTAKHLTQQGYKGLKDHLVSDYALQAEGRYLLNKLKTDLHHISAMGHRTFQREKEINQKSA